MALFDEPRIGDLIQRTPQSVDELKQFKMLNTLLDLLDQVNQVILSVEMLRQEEFNENDLALAFRKHLMLICLHIEQLADKYPKYWLNQPLGWIYLDPELIGHNLPAEPNERGGFEVVGLISLLDLPEIIKWTTMDEIKRPGFGVKSKSVIHTLALPIPLLMDAYRCILSFLDEIGLSLTVEEHQDTIIQLGEEWQQFFDFSAVEVPEE